MSAFYSTYVMEGSSMLVLFGTTHFATTGLLKPTFCLLLHRGNPLCLWGAQVISICLHHMTCSLWRHDVETSPPSPFLHLDIKGKPQGRLLTGCHVMTSLVDMGDAAFSRGNSTWQWWSWSKLKGTLKVDYSMSMIGIDLKFSGLILWILLVPTVSKYSICHNYARLQCILIY